MPYIRLKDCIAKVSIVADECYYCSMHDNPQLKDKGLQIIYNAQFAKGNRTILTGDFYCIYKSLIIKESKYLKDVCDKFMDVYKDEEPLITDYYTMVFYHKHNNEYKYRDGYGAIWTDKGLIYVAKLNDKSKLELLNI